MESESLNDVGEQKTPSPARLWFIVAAAFVLFWGVYLALFFPRAEPPRGNADYNWKYLDLDDVPVAFSRYKGKVVFLNIWATWCPPCVEEMPSIARLAANPRLKDVAFVCVSVDDSAATVRRFLRDKDWSMTILRAHSLPENLQTDGIPATFIIAPDGRIVVAEVGGKDWDTTETVERLASLLKK